MKKLVLAAAFAVATPAAADVLTVGYSNSTTGGAIVTLATSPRNRDPILDRSGHRQSIHAEWFWF
jgi:hypothetical protein